MGPLMTTNMKRWVLGFCSTLFLAAGLVRAADKLDPLSRELTSTKGQLSSTQNCTTTCQLVTDESISSAPACSQMRDIAQD